MGIRQRPIPPSLGGPPHVAGLVVSVVDEPTTKFAGLASGDLDVAGISPATAPLAARDPSMRVLDYPVLFSTGLVFNVPKPPFDDSRIRRAISLSIDRERIMQGPPDLVAQRRVGATESARPHDINGAKLGQPTRCSMRPAGYATSRDLPPRRRRSSSISSQ
jgi:ABC-type oligopeptide transport system substrate-binding subunit